LFDDSSGTRLFLFYTSSGEKLTAIDEDETMIKKKPTNLDSIAIEA
jgi:hypothetical protein